MCLAPHTHAHLSRNKPFGFHQGTHKDVRQFLIKKRGTTKEGKKKLIRETFAAALTVGCELPCVGGMHDSSFVSARITYLLRLRAHGKKKGVCDVVSRKAIS